MLCEDFFIATIEKHAEKDPSLRGPLDEHAASCASCTELVQDYPLMSSALREIPSRIEPPAWMKERVAVMAREAIANRARRRKVAQARRVGLRRVLVAASLVGVLAVGSFGLVDRSTSSPVTPSVSPGVPPVGMPILTGHGDSLNEVRLAHARDHLSRGEIDLARAFAQGVLADHRSTADEKAAAHEILEQTK